MIMSERLRQEVAPECCAVAAADLQAQIVAY